MTYLATGDVLAGRYRIEEEVGRGGYSVVYRAADLTLETPVAVKLLVPPPASEAVARERMRREALVARGLSHPNVVQLHDFVERDGRSFLVMEFVDGPDVARRVADRGPLEAAEAVSVFRGISEALAAAHEMGVLHRDVKPQNVLLNADGRARLADFGSARLVDMESVTRTGGLVGTVAYTAPEILAGERGDARSDLYSLGMTLYFALVGRLPGQASPHLPPPPSDAGFRPAELVPDTPESLDRVTAALTRKDPGLRYPTARTVVEALDDERSAALGYGGLARRSDCLLCGDPDTFGVGLCPSCLGPRGGKRSEERLLFLERGDDRAHRLEIADRIHDLVEDRRSAADIEAALRGELPIARTGAAAADRAASHLRESGLPVRVTHPLRVGARLTPTLGAVLGTAIALGTAAGMLVSTSMLFVTPLFATVVVWSAVRRQSPPLISFDRSSALPASIEDPVRDALAGMDEGTGRRLLADLVRMARQLHSTATGPDPDEELHDNLKALLEGATHLASELSGLDAGLQILEGLPPESAASEAWLDSYGRAVRARDRLVQTLLDAVAALARSLAAGTGGRSDRELRLSELVSEVEHEAGLRAEVQRELEELLTPDPGFE